jgi:hypothetical protein
MLNKNAAELAISDKNHIADMGTHTDAAGLGAIYWSQV